MGMTVVIASQTHDPTEIVHPSALAPVDVKKGKVFKNRRLSASEDFRWQPEKSVIGPISIIMSRSDRRVLVFRNGIEIGRAKIKQNKPKIALGTHAFIMQEGPGFASSPILSSAPEHRWLAVGLPGHASPKGEILQPSQKERIQIPTNFASALYNLLEPGTTLLVTDAPIIEQQTTGINLSLINSDNPDSTNSARSSLNGPPH